MARIVVVDYDPAWARHFEQLRASLWEAVHDAAISIEHVGSTSVPGLAAKPIVDLDIVVRSSEESATVIQRLDPLGYTHRGDLGIVGREAFRNPPGGPTHHLYVCLEGSLGLRNHLAVRDYLRSHPDKAIAYGELKRQLAEKFPDDIDSYIDGKADFLQGILRASGFQSQELATIATPNRKSD